jgi:hypothetical protein
MNKINNLAMRIDEEIANSVDNITMDDVKDVMWGVRDRLRFRSDIFDVPPEIIDEIS